MKKAGFVLAVALGLPLVLTLLIKVLGALHSALSRMLVFLLWLVTAAAAALYFLGRWKKPEPRERAQKSPRS